MLLLNIYLSHLNVTTVGQNARLQDNQLADRSCDIIGEAPWQGTEGVNYDAVDSTAEGIVTIEQVILIRLKAIALCSLVLRRDRHYRDVLQEGEIGTVAGVADPVGTHHANGIGSPLDIVDHAPARFGCDNILLSDMLASKQGILHPEQRARGTIVEHHLDIAEG